MLVPVTPAPIAEYVTAGPAVVLPGAMPCKVRLPAVTFAKLVKLTVAGRVVVGLGRLAVGGAYL